MKPIALIALLGLLKHASGQLEVIWDRSYEHLTGIHLSGVSYSGTGRIVMVGGVFGGANSALYRSIDRDGEVHFEASITNSGRQVRTGSTHLLHDERVVVACTSCPVSTFVAGYRLYWATESSLGRFVGPLDVATYADPFQVQQDGSIIGLRPRTTSDGRQSIGVDKWYWGATVPMWQAHVVPFASSEVQALRFASNMPLNRAVNITPLVAFRSGQAFQYPYWASIDSAGAFLWAQTTSAQEVHGYVMDDLGAQYLLLANVSGGNHRWIVKCDADGQLRWTFDIGPGRYALSPGVDRNGILYALFVASDGLSEWIAINSETGEQINRAPVDRLGREGQFAWSVHFDEFGGVYALWQAYDGDFTGSHNEKNVLAKYDEWGATIWAWDIEDTDSLGYNRTLRMNRGIGVIVKLGAQRIIKFRIRAAFVEGDASGDGCIDDKDLAMTLEAFGTSDPTADFDSSGIVDDRDLERVLRNFGLGCVE